MRAPLVLLLALSPAAVLAADLRITDSRGTEVVVTGAVVDYSSMLTVDKDADGIRVLQGDAVVKLKWTDVDAVTVTKADTAARPPKLDLEVALRNGKRVSATLFRQGSMKITGKSDLGEYAIELDKIRKIAPAR